MFIANEDSRRVLGRVRIDERAALPLADAKRYIESIDFEMLVYKLGRPDPNVASEWTEEAARSAIRYYRNFLWLLRKYGREHDAIPPSVEIDEIWHHHILDTVKYHADCDQIFGAYLHHYPYFGMRGADDLRALGDAFLVTQRLHELEFGEPIGGFAEEVVLEGTPATPA